MVRTIEAQQHDLLDRYDAVLVTDVDEIVVPVPGRATLGDYIDRFDEEFVKCLGYEVIHLVHREGRLDASRPVLDQRRYWFANDAYDKPARHRDRQRRAWNDRDLAEKWASHNRITEEPNFGRWFYEDSGFEDIDSWSNDPRSVEGRVLGLRDILRRAIDRVDRALYPEATSAADQWQRVRMNEAIDAHITSLDPPTRSAAEISGDSHADKPWRAYTSLMYPDFDLCAPITRQRGFDVVICEQVLEHVVDPWGAAANLRELTVPGGHLIVSTPFLIKVHELPFFDLRDYWRFTPRGLRTLLESAGLEVDVVETWGNRRCVVGNLSRWSARRRWHSLRNDPDLPVQVWALARKPAHARTDVTPRVSGTPGG